MKAQILFLALIIFTFSACKKTYILDPANPTGGGSGPGGGSTTCANTAVWAKNNNQWVYEISNTLLPTDTLYTKYLDAGPRIFRVLQQFDDGTLFPIDTAYAEFCNNKVYNANNIAMANKLEAYRLDGVVGETWSNTSTSSLGNTVTNECKIIAKNVMVTVPLGTFSCLHINTKSTVGTQVVTGNIYLNSQKGLVQFKGSTVDYDLVRTNF
jgi:hypothetical protein